MGERENWLSVSVYAWRGWAVCPCMCGSQRSTCEVVSPFRPLCRFWDLNLSVQACVRNTFTILPVHMFDFVLNFGHFTFGNLSFVKFSWFYIQFMWPSYGIVIHGWRTCGPKTYTVVRICNPSPQEDQENYNDTLSQTKPNKLVNWVHKGQWK